MTLGALILAAAVPAGAWTWAPPPEHVEIGTPVALTARLEAPEGPLKPVPGQQTGAYEVLGASVGPDGTATANVMVFALGRQSLPPLQWLAGDKQVSSPAFELTVIPPPPLPSDTGDIRDIRGPYRARMGPWWALLALLLAAVGYALWRLTRKAPPPAALTPQTPADNRTPEERALDSLEALEKIGLPVKEFYDRLSDIVRQYLLERHGVDALKMTTYDIQRALIKEGFPPPARQAVKELFDRCDLAKFAKMRPTDQEGRRDLESAKKAVKLLAPAASGVEGDLALGAGR